MKKLRKFASVLMLAATVVFAAGCTKPDEPNNEGNDNNGGGGETPEVPTAPTGAIDGKFSINATGGKVYFAKGNLQYQASTNTFRFAEHQWNYVGGSTEENQLGNVEGSDNCLVSSTYEGWIDLFCYGTSGWNGGAEYCWPYDYSGSANGFLPYNLTGEYANADWGVYNPISNGGNQAGMWRTLTNDEWEYIINGRSSEIRYAMAQVNGVNGLILVPDDWNNSVYELKYVNSTAPSWEVNKISLSLWENTLEPAGCVFLPNAGHRNIGSVILVTETKGYGDYWTSTVKEDNLSVYIVGIYWQGPHLGTAWANGGYSVRLVRDVQ
jgi:hypothetical protein